MDVIKQKRTLQIIVAIACLVPLIAGGMGAFKGPEGLWTSFLPANTISHYRYLSGLLFGIGIGFLSCLPGIEARTDRFRVLSFIVVVGGLARLLGALVSQNWTAGVILPLMMELCVVPALVIWQARVARRSNGSITAQK